MLLDKHTGKMLSSNNYGVCAKTKQMRRRTFDLASETQQRLTKQPLELLQSASRNGAQG